MFFNKNKAENKICDDAFALTVKGDYEASINLLKGISANFGRAALLEGLILAVMGKNEETYNYDEIKRLLTLASDKGYSLAHGICAEYFFFTEGEAETALSYAKKGIAKGDFKSEIVRKVVEDVSIKDLYRLDKNIDSYIRNLKGEELQIDELCKKTSFQLTYKDWKILVNGDLATECLSVDNIQLKDIYLDAINKVKVETNNCMAGLLKGQYLFNHAHGIMTNTMQMHSLEKALNAVKDFREAYDSYFRKWGDSYDSEAMLNCDKELKELFNAFIELEKERVANGTLRDKLVKNNSIAKGEGMDMLLALSDGVQRWANTPPKSEPEKEYVLDNGEVLHRDQFGELRDNYGASYGLIVDDTGHVYDEKHNKVGWIDTMGRFNKY